MQISAHDYHNKANSGPTSSINLTNTPAWAHTWSAQNNVSATQVKATGGTYA